MRSAIYIQDGDVQLALMGENEWERNCLRTLHEALPGTFWAKFFETNGGYIRQDAAVSSFDNRPFDGSSLMIRAKRGLAGEGK